MAPALLFALHVLGPLAAVSLSVTLLASAWRERASSAGRRDAARLAGWTAAAALAWNLGALASAVTVSGTPGPGLRALLAVAFSAFGFLPALYGQAALRGRAEPPRWERAVPAAAYVLAAASGVAHFWLAAEGGTPPSRGALRAVAVGVLFLTPAFLVASRGIRRRGRLLSAAALAVFGVSAWHLSRHVSVDEPLSSVLLGHHASIPLVVGILWQDFRFVFTDVFLKRAASLLLLGALVLGLYAAVVLPFQAASALADGRQPLAVGLLLAAWGGTALAYPVLQSGVARFVDAALLGRGNLAERRTSLARDLLAVESEEDVLRTVANDLDAAMGSPGLRWADVDAAPPSRGTTVVPVPTVETPRFRLEVGRPAGGRLLSGDLELLEWAALLAARRIDAVRLTHERCQRDLREKQIEQLAAEAELRELRAQLNPHFLFNALNTVGALMRTSPERARRTLLDLTSLLRAVLRRSGGEFSTLGQELDLVESYLAIEQARFEERIVVERTVPAELRRALVPPLVLQPLVENAIKHGLAPKREGGRLRLRVCCAGGRLDLEVEDDGAGSTPAALARGRARGIGLGNVEKRLAAYFGPDGSLRVESRPGRGTTARVSLPFVEEGAATRASERRVLTAIPR
ncbi:MAG: histidine kinase [Vicinamibacteria bacterium]